MLYLTIDEMRSRLDAYEAKKLPTADDFIALNEAFTSFAEGQRVAIEAVAGTQGVQQESPASYISRMNQDRISL